MDKLIDTAKDYLDERKQRDQEQSQGQAQASVGHQQQQEDAYPAPGAKPPGSGVSSLHGDIDYDDASEEATRQAGPSGSKDLFSSILSIVSQKKVAEDDLDEDGKSYAVKKHKTTYNEDEDDKDGDEKSLGVAAAIQALKLFNKGETGGNQSQSAFLGLAMSEASKLFDAKSSEGKVSSATSKEATIQQAAEMAVKLFLKSKGDEQGGLLSLASKFLSK